MPSGRAHTPQAAADAMLRQVAQDHASAEPELTAAILKRLRQTIPEFFADRDVAYDMTAAVAANVARFRLLLTEAPNSSTSEALPVEASDLLQSTIQHGIPLISLLEAYRAAQALAADWWQLRLEQTVPPGSLAPATRTLNQLLLTYIDAAATVVRDSYEIERRTLENSPDGRRDHLIRKLLAREALDTDAASRTLNHPLTGRHVAVVLWRTDDISDGALQDALAPISAALGQLRQLTTSTRHRVYAWLSTNGTIDAGPARRLRTPPGINAAMSGVHSGVEGFVQAHDDAVRAAEVVRDRASPGDGSIAVFEQLELITLLSRDREACDRFVQRVLGRLADDTRDAARARETLRVYLASGSSPTRAAERLGVHRNTVNYRLNALDDLLPDIDPDAGDWSAQTSPRLELELALQLADQLGAAHR